MKITLDDQVLLITGVGSGIGQALARQALESGMRVHGVDLNAEALETLQTETEIGPRFTFHALDLRDNAGLEALVASVIDQEGRIDALANVAGVSYIASLEETSSELLDATLAVNLIAPFRLCQLVAPHMKKRRKGRILNLASELAIVGQPGLAAYSASKGAVLGFTRALAAELAPHGIQINALCPGPVETPMLKAEFATEKDPDAARIAALASIPMGRLGQPDEVAKVALFMLSDAASFMQGSSVVVDGGKTIV